ncbi:MFS general substrate transporter [Eremomyces bilateralis CBS 781.70]|uniref:MFS general substrate transporter n=1 Tax=Eremomyces bilateralis CBS 781.70 TaxID=1392243 RepID=A0A6G1GA22_9PEZI|nr:MFS general substrate transporter [Eremomyces bilateralis CBS 781.70]KAF1814751.1 MFS general substrate transporter [Eremomyces bilateralis CBS 781.70]
MSEKSQYAAKSSSADVTLNGNGLPVGRAIDEEKQLGRSKEQGKQEDYEQVVHAEYEESTGPEDVTGEPAVRIDSVNNLDTIPNGGLRAWCQVAGSFFLFFNTWGIINSFGVFQAFYTTDFLKSMTPSTIAWIGSIQAFLLLMVGALTGPLYDAGYFRWLLRIGSVLIVFGMMMLSLATTYWQALLAQAICVGLGMGCLFVPSVAILSTYFTTKLAFAMGLAASGSSFGGIIYPILLNKLIPKLGFGWSVRIFAFIAMATLIVPNTFMRVRVLPDEKRKLYDMTAWRERPFVYYVIGGFFGFMGLYCPFYYMQSFSLYHGIADKELAFYFLAIINAASTFGRILPNFVADKAGPLNILMPCAVLTGVVELGLIGCRDLASLIVICVLFGFFSGTFVSLSPAALVQITRNRGMIGTRMGMCFTVTSFGTLVGMPIAGAILTASSYTYIWVFGGVLTIVGASFMATARVAHVGWGLTTKA